LTACNTAELMAAAAALLDTDYGYWSNLDITGTDKRDLSCFYNPGSSIWEQSVTREVMTL
jgi:hypothetical protein